MPPRRPIRPTPLPTPPSEASLASDLAASQAQDMFEEERRRSPLELKPKSYAEAPEYTRQREAEQEMLETGEQLVGAPVVPTVERPPSPGPEEAPPETTRRRSRRGTTAAAPETEALRAAAVEEGIAKEERARERRLVQEEQSLRQRQLAYGKEVVRRRVKRKIMLRVAPFLGPCCFFASIVVLGFLIQMFFVILWASKAIDVFGF